MMNERENKDKDQPYIREKIVKKNNTVAALKRLLWQIVLALVFGVVVSVVVVFLVPRLPGVIPGLAMETEPAPTESSHSSIKLPTYRPDTEPEEDTDEFYSSEPEESSEVLTEESPTLPPSPEGILSPQDREWIDYQIQSRLAGKTIEMADIKSMNKSIYNMYRKTEGSMVTIRCVNPSENIFNRIKQETVGLLIHMDEEQLIFLTDLSTVEAYLSLSFECLLSGAAENATHELNLIATEHILGLAMFSLPASSLTDAEKRRITPIEFGNTYLTSLCDMVMVVGSPYGGLHSVAFGNITRIDVGRVTTDTTYRMFYTDIQSITGGSGFLINTSGQLIGLVTGTAQIREKTIGQSLCAIGIEEINSLLTSMASGKARCYLGVTGQNVTREIAAKTGMPIGVYVTEVVENSPAYQAGILPGDIIVAASTSRISTMAELFKTLMTDHLPSESVKLQVMRERREGEFKELELSIVLGSRE